MLSSADYPGGFANSVYACFDLFLCVNVQADEVQAPASRYMG
jgi:hypothetical protein